MRNVKRPLTILLFTYILCVCALHEPFLQTAQASQLSSSSWAAPSYRSLRRIGALPAVAHTLNLFDNIDCTELSYRLISSNTMQSGCFTTTAWGFMDPDDQILILNGTDEGIPLKPYVSNQTLVPWVKSSELLSLNSLSTGGALISLYKNPLTAMQNKIAQNGSSGLTYLTKQLAQPADLTLKDAKGNNLVVNYSSLAFSRGGSWLAAETRNGSFVRINLASLDILPFAQPFGSQGGQNYAASKVSITENGRYAVIVNVPAEEFRVYDLENCGEASKTSTLSLPPKDCSSANYWSFIKANAGTFESMRQVRFVNENLISFEGLSADPKVNGTYEIAPADRISSLINYLGMGDSYTSGEGAYNYLSKTDTSTNKCHLSVRSYPLLLAADLFGNSGAHSVACSGAVIKDIGSTSDHYRGQVKDGPDFATLSKEQPQLLQSILSGYTPGYLAQQRFVSLYQPAVTSVSVGGNDIGFSNILSRCVLYHASLHHSDNTCFNTYEDRQEVLQVINRTGPQWTALFRQLQAEAPETRLYAIGYPQIVYDRGDCGLNVHFDKSELEFSVELINYLNAAINNAASQAGVAYVDISKSLYGHRLCEAKNFDIAVNGLTAGNDTGPLGHESYHPNALGHSLIEQTILQKTKNFTRTEAAETASLENALLAQAPRSGRPVFTLIPVSDLTRSVQQRGATAELAFTSEGTTKGSAIYSVHLDGSTTPSTASTVSSAQGDIKTSIHIPSSLTPGEHTVDITGPSQTDDLVDIQQPVFVAAQPDDADGDGIPDSDDSCPYALNLLQDNDDDGIDDTCDPLVGPFSSGTKGGSGLAVLIKAETGSRRHSHSLKSDSHNNLGTSYSAQHNPAKIYVAASAENTRAKRSGPVHRSIALTCAAGLFVAFGLSALLCRQQVVMLSKNRCQRAGFLGTILK